MQSQKEKTDNVSYSCVISVQDLWGNKRDGRVLLDTRAQSHFITQEFCNKLNLNLTPINKPVSGLGNQQTNLTHKMEIILKSKYNAYPIKITCLVIRCITGNMPNMVIDLASLRIPKNLTLAYPQFYQSRSINLLYLSDLHYFGIFYALIKFH